MLLVTMMKCRKNITFRGKITSLAPLLNDEFRMNEKKKRKKQFRLNFKESFERRIRTPEPFYNKYEEMRKEPVSTPKNIENIFG